MKFKKILCIGFSGEEFDEFNWNKIDSLAENRVISSVSDAQTQHSEADAVLVKLGTSFTKKQIDEFPDLRYIGMLGTGYGGINTSYAADKGITVTNIADYATEAVSEFTFGILLEYYRDIAKARTQAKSGNYSDEFVGGEIKDKKFGVIGLGDIGKRTAQLALAFGADVSYWSKNRKDDFEANGAKYAELDSLIANSDILTINLANNDQTEGILNVDRIKAIKSDAIVINPSPMELLDYGALIERLKQNDIVFMLDHSDEMSEEQLKQLLTLDNCIVYPAIAYLTNEASLLKEQVYIDNINNFLSNTPTNKVN